MGQAAQTSPAHQKSVIAVSALCLFIKSNHQKFPNLGAVHLLIITTLSKWQVVTEKEARFSFRPFTSFSACCNNNHHAPFGCMNSFQCALKANYAYVYLAMLGGTS
jgi:hypothetical protein